MYGVPPILVPEMAIDLKGFHGSLRVFHGLFSGNLIGHEFYSPN